MNKKVLIIDDDAHIRKLLHVILEAKGFTTIQACDGSSGIELALREHPELVVLDVMMPEMDGWEVCKLIRDDRQLNKLKILMLTARGTVRDRMIGKDILGADAYMTKPFDIDELLSTVDSLI